MKQISAILISLMVATGAAQSGYKYQAPQRQQQQILPIRPSQPLQSNPVAQYSIPAHTQALSQPSPPAISLPPPLAPAQASHVNAPVPARSSLPIQISPPHQHYLPPLQQQPQQQQVFGHQTQQQQQPIFGNHQQQQQPQHQFFSQPQTLQQFIQPSQQAQQQFSQPIQNTGFQQNVQSFQRPQQTIITKDIFIHSAPEDQDNDIGAGPQYETGPVRKNYRIVFIKAPTPNLRSAAAAIQRAQANNEEKTIIYVLSKKPDLSEVQQQLQVVQGEQKVNKPEVYFIKYKTQEEAQRAQQEIQAQYDALGGSTHISDEGIAPVTNVGSGGLNLGGAIGGGIGGGGEFQQSGAQQQSFGQQSYQSHSGGGQTYLPPRTVKK